MRGSGPHRTVFAATEQGKAYKDAVKVEGSLEVRKTGGPTMIAGLAAEIVNGVAST
jgi:hypothetical protein